MNKEDCVFCKVIRGELPSYKVYEDEDFVGILDIFPNTKGMTLLIPKEHFDSYIFDMPDEVYIKFLIAAKKLGKKIDEKIGTERTALVMEGMGVNHAHIKLYPLHGLEKDFKPMLSKHEKKYFENYEGYLTTAMGPRAGDDALEKIRNLLVS